MFLPICVFSRAIGLFNLVLLCQKSVLLFEQLGHKLLMRFLEFFFIPRPLLQRLLLILLIQRLDVTYLFLQCLDLKVPLFLTIPTIITVLIISVLLRIILVLQLSNLVLQNLLILPILIHFFLRREQLKLHQLIQLPNRVNIRRKLTRVHLIGIKFLVHLIIRGEDPYDFSRSNLQVENCLPLLLRRVLIVQWNQLDSIFEAVVGEVLLELGVLYHDLADPGPEVVYHFFVALAQFSEELLIQHGKDAQFACCVLDYLLNTLCLHVYRFVIEH